MEEAKKKIEQLIAKYEEVKTSGIIKKYTEEDTKNGFIIPLFEVLGWDFYNRNEITAEEHITGKRVDYGVYLNGVVKFFLEASPQALLCLRMAKAAKLTPSRSDRRFLRKGVQWTGSLNFSPILIIRFS